jgi:uncharacterized phiE125 gp8 family phage protein
MLTLNPLVLGEDALADLRAWLRMETEEEDPLLLALVAAAVRHCEAFAGIILIKRSGTARLAVSSDWKLLPVTPVRSITNVMGIPAEGAAFLMPASDYAVDIDANGDGWIRVLNAGAAGRIDVTVDAGLATDWASLAEPIRLAALRLTGYLHTHRDEADDAGPPAAVAALLRPWRRMRLG